KPPTAEHVTGNKRELLWLRQRGRGINPVRLRVRLHVRLIGWRREFRCEHRRNRPRAVEGLGRGTLACRHAFVAANFWPLAGFREIVPVLPRSPPIRAHDNARLVVVDNERLDARAVRIRTIARARAARGNIGGTRGPHCNRSNCASTHRHNSSSSKWILSI